LTPGILGLLGPHGAGKSTLLRILATITRPTEGQARWNDEDLVRRPVPLRRTLGYLPQDFGVYPHLTAREFLEYLAAVKGVPAAVARGRIAELLALVNLVEAQDRPLGGFSGGMRQRVGIAQALLNDPQLLIVDEPTVGLDPEERVRFRNLLADRIALLDHGRLLECDTPEELLRGAQGRVWEWIVPSERFAVAKVAHRLSAAGRRADGVHVRAVAASAGVPTFDWNGTRWTAGILASRLGWLALATALAALAAVPLHRFDPSRGRGRGKARARAGRAGADAGEGAAAGPPARRRAAGRGVRLSRLLPGGLLGSELRLLLVGAHPAWWLTVLGLWIPSVLVPLSTRGAARSCPRSGWRRWCAGRRSGRATAAGTPRRWCAPLRVRRFGCRSRHGARAHCSRRRWACRRRCGCWPARSGTGRPPGRRGPRSSRPSRWPSAPGRAAPGCSSRSAR
jgi:ABC-type taurine transport system ATPase subunit